MVKVTKTIRKNTVPKVPKIIQKRKYQNIQPNLNKLVDITPAYISPFYKFLSNDFKYKSTS
ncbi:hypothetical protein [Bacillus salipaludis]|uniref:Uncharacterized protein n=1 Tax=Bacillus salipaludis TaxID=2547811 RepID=A0AA90R5Y8_9BACI|nr:hypothetical protein [Bacillus salipaludis]MDQ6596433.1 hypothetical protein [Bacillus salipaludis]